MQGRFFLPIFTSALGIEGRTELLRIFVVACCGLGSFTLPAHAQTPLSAYADAKGYINVQKLTCAQLAGTFQEDADFLGTWYSGWYNGLAKKSSINIPRVKDGIHEVIVYCKANPDKRIIQAIDAVIKAEKK
ncbi:HdeA/HdeB family protein [Rhizobiales bacterium GAS113]|nr:HdeA/HdeB family protein [Rhizobiales bacterium GAS113]